jgi:hypothetical protein
MGCQGGSITFTADTSAAGFSYVHEEYMCEFGFEQGSALCSRCETNAGDGFARQAGGCNKCSMNETFYVVIALLTVLFWFPLQRLLITKMFRSLYTTTSFVQYLGFYHMFRVPWDSYLSNLFLTFSFFTLDLESIHLTCAGFTFVDIWHIQMFLPFLYPVAMSFVVLGNLVLSALADKKLPPTVTMMKLGWMPQRHFSPSALLEQYVPPALFYFNMYYYTGISKSFEMLTCLSNDPSDSNAKEHLSTAPWMTCWEGEHASYVPIAVTGVVVYMVILPCWLSYVLLVIVPRNGLNDKKTILNFGFLYRRFLPHLWWWELIEILRKLAFVTIGWWGYNLTAINKSSLALATVIGILVFELYSHPFRSALYDVLEEFTTFTEVVTILLGILVIAGGGASDYSWVQPTALIIIILSLVLVAWSLVVDFSALMRIPQNSRLRQKKQVLLSPAIFNLELHAHAVSAYVAQASEAQLDRMRTVESILVSWSLQIDKALDKLALNQWNEMASNEPRLVKWMATQAYREHPSQNGESSPARDYVNANCEMIRVKKRRTSKTSGVDASYFFLSETGRALLCTWLASVHATPDSIDTVTAFFDDLTAFDLQRQMKLKTTLIGRQITATYASYYDKTMTKLEKTYTTKTVQILAEQEPEQQIALGLKHRQSIGDLTKLSIGDLPNDDASKLLSALYEQLGCEAVLIASESMPKYVVQSKNAKLTDKDWKVEPKTAAGVADESKQPIQVNNILLETRVDLAKVNKSSISLLCVPIAHKTVLVAINKVSIDSNKAVPFPSSDLQLMQIFGSVLFETLIKIGHLSKDAPPRTIMPGAAIPKANVKPSHSVPITPSTTLSITTSSTTSSMDDSAA